MPEKAYLLYFEGKQIKVTNLAAFCKVEKLNERHMRQMISGARKHYHGWSKSGPIVRPERDRKRIAEIAAMMQPGDGWEAKLQEDGRWSTFNKETQEWGEVAW